jgi:tetratricopeptide (TPR) repeat protein
VENCDKNGVMLLIRLAIAVLSMSLSLVDAYVPSDRRLIREIHIPATAERIQPSRGILQASTNAIASLDTSVDSRLLARQYVQDGMLAFRLGNVSKSIELFDMAEQMDASISPYLWQRGLSYYYANDFEKASQQFRADVRVNPYDVEEVVWDVASQLQANRNRHPEMDPVFPIPNQISLPVGSTDRRRIMVGIFVGWLQ